MRVVCPRTARSGGGRSAVVAARSDGPRAWPPAQMGPGHIRLIRRTRTQPVRSSGRACGRVERDRANHLPDRAAAKRFSPSARSDHRCLGRTAGMPSDSSDGTDGSDGATSDCAVIMWPRHPCKNLTVWNFHRSPHINCSLPRGCWVRPDVWTFVTGRRSRCMEAARTSDLTTLPPIRSSFTSEWREGHRGSVGLTLYPFRIGGPPIRWQRSVEPISTPPRPVPFVVSAGHRYVQFRIFPVMSLLDHNASGAGMAAWALYRRAANTVVVLSSLHLESRVLSADTDSASADRASSRKLYRELIPGPIR